MDIEIKKLSPEDIDEFFELIRVFETVFEMDNFKMPDGNHLQTLLAKPDFLTLVAKEGDKVIGGLTVYVLHRYYNTKPIAYVYDVGVLTAYQRRGVGKKLIAYLTNYCREKGFEEAFVQAETEDTAALKFYRTTAFSSELQATQFNYLTL